MKKYWAGFKPLGPGTIHWISGNFPDFISASKGLASRAKGLGSKYLFYAGPLEET